MSEAAKHRSENPGYEQSDAQFKALLISLLSLVGLLLITMVFIYGVYVFLADFNKKLQGPPPTMAFERQLPPLPHLQVHPNQEWADFAAEQDSVINGAGWVSKEAGVARIPIEAAMDMMLERGYPVRPQQTSSGNGAAQ